MDSFISRKEVIEACRDAGFTEAQWGAMTFQTGPYDITEPTSQLRNLVHLLTGRIVSLD